MKKYLLIIFLFLILCGCGKNNSESLIDKFKSKIEKTNQYLLKGKMSITSNEDTFTYNVTASKDKENNYMISLINLTNDHEQIILKNKDGVYVVTPDLNKSFKFQSDWPNNGSQSYLLDVLIKDVENDKELHIENDGKNNIIQSKVNYPNNSNLYSQKIYIDKNYDVKKVEVLDQDGKVKITLEVNSINYKPKFDKEYFELSNYIKDIEEIDESLDNGTEENKEEASTSNILEDIIYPLYIPENTHLSTEDTINTDNGNRAILTFAGDKPFIIVEEMSRRNEELEIIPINGDPLVMSDCIGAISANSLYWTSNGIDYYVSSTSLSGEELMTIAEGLTGTSIIVSSEK